ncbi:MAG: type II secretion system F family protein [Actinomycetota bacterium]
MTLLHQVAVITGAIAGIGLLLVVRAMWPRHPHLGSTVQALTAATPHAEAVPATGRGWRVRLGSAVLRRWPTLPGVRIPYRNLALIGVPVSRYIGERAVFAAAGWFAPTLLSMIAGLGWSLTTVVAVGVAPALAVAASFIPDYTVTAAAKRARQDFTIGMSAFADLVALQVASGTGTTQAVETAAELGDSWVFTRLGEELRRAEFTQTPPWDALRRVSDELDLPMLGDVADILRLSVERSVTVGESLRARAHALRLELLSEEHERANAASEQMSAPVAGLTLTFMLLLVTPAMLELV